jgi:hypothetical protein
MSVVLNGDSIALIGDCGVSEAEDLVSLIQTNPQFVIDVSASGAVHTALWQALLTFKPNVAGEPDDAFVREWIMPALAAGGSGSKLSRTG